MVSDSFRGAYPLHADRRVAEPDPRFEPTKLKGWRCSVCIAPISELEYRRNQRCRPCMKERAKLITTKAIKIEAPVRIIPEASEQLFGRGGRYGNPY